MTIDELQAKLKEAADAGAVEVVRSGNQTENLAFRDVRGGFCGMLDLRTGELDMIPETERGGWR